MAAPAAVAADPQATGRVLVTLEPAASGARAAAVTTAAGARVAGPRVPQIRLLTVRPPAGGSPSALARRLRADPRVAAVDVEHRARLRALPNDPALTEPSALSGLPPGTPVEWWAARAGFTRAWDLVSGDDALIAMIDTGVDGSHPDLAGRIAGSADNDAGGGSATVDQVGHGTHVGSLACAARGNAIGLAGAGNGCRLLVARSDLSDSSVAASIVWAADRGARAIAMSFGTDGPAPAPRAIVDALRYAVRHGAVPVAAAADAPVEEQGYPANVLQPTGTGPDTAQNLGLSVTASTFTGVAAAFAGRGTQISLAAPGTTLDDGRDAGLLGAFPAGVTSLETGAFQGAARAPCECRTTFGGDTRWAYLQGTSMAVPLVAAAAALIRTANPALPSADVVRVLKLTAARPGGVGWRLDVGWGVLDAAAAVSVARGIDRTPPASRLRASQRRAGSASVLLRWSGGDPAPRGLVPSGVAAWEVWHATAGGRARRIARLRAGRRALRVTLRRGVSHRLFTIAVDRAGNRETPPAGGDATLRIRPA